MSALKASATDEHGVLDMRLLSGGIPEDAGVEEIVKALIRRLKNVSMLDIVETLKVDGTTLSFERLDQIVNGLVEEQFVRRLRGQVVLVE